MVGSLEAYRWSAINQEVERLGKTRDRAQDLFPNQGWHDDALVQKHLRPFVEDFRASGDQRSEKALIASIRSVRRSLSLFMTLGVLGMTLVVVVAAPFFILNRAVSFRGVWIAAAIFGLYFFITHS